MVYDQKYQLVIIFRKTKYEIDIEKLLYVLNKLKFEYKINEILEPKALECFLKKHCLYIAEFIEYISK